MTSTLAIKTLVSCLLVVIIECQDSKIRKAAILNQMREWGSKTFESGLYNTGKVKNQFLVAAFVPENVLNDVKELYLIDKCPTQQYQINEQKFSDTSMICGTSAVVFNRVDEEIWKRSQWNDKEAYKDHSWHGEYIFLYEGILEQLEKNFKTLFPNQPCQIVLYSFFIPCNYNSEGQPYKCSNLLSGYDGSGDKCKITTIGYTSAHPATAKNLDVALKALRNKYEVIKIAATSKDPSTVLVETAVRQIAQASTVTFQDVFYSCLKRSPLLDCCIQTSSADNVDHVFSYYANLMVKESVKGTNFGSSLSLTNAQKNSIEIRFQQQIVLSLGTDCNECRDLTRLRLFVKLCSKKAFDMTDFFGTTDGNSLPLHKWVKYEDKWINIFKHIADYFWDTGRMRCFPNLSVPSLCTKKESTAGTSGTGPAQKRARPVNDEQESYLKKRDRPQ